MAFLCEILQVLHGIGLIQAGTLPDSLGLSTVSNGLLCFKYFLEALSFLLQIRSEVGQPIINLFFEEFFADPPNHKGC
jgi:hypothetical protein